MSDQEEMIQKKVRPPQLQIEQMIRLVESGENKVKAQQDVQNQTITEPMQQVTERHIAQDEVDKGRGEKNAELLINYDNIDTVEKESIL